MKERKKIPTLIFVFANVNTIKIVEIYIIEKVNFIGS